MNRKCLLTFLLLIFVPLSVAAQGADNIPASPAYQEFRAKMQWYLKAGGQWIAENPSYDSKQESSIQFFGYQFSEGYAPDILRLRITGRIAGRDYLYWDGFYYWHSLKNRGIYVAQGTGGAIASGEFVDGATTLVFEVIWPDHIVAQHRDEEQRINDNEFMTNSYRYSEKGWVFHERLTWRRVTEKQQ